MNLIFILSFALSSASKFANEEEFLKALLQPTSKSESRSSTRRSTESLIPIDRRSSSRSTSSGRSSSSESSRRSNSSGVPRCSGSGSCNRSRSTSNRSSNYSNSRSGRSSSNSSRSSSTIVVNKRDVDRIIELLSGYIQAPACAGPCPEIPTAPTAPSGTEQPYIYHSYVAVDGRTYYFGTDSKVYYWAEDGRWSIYDGTTAYTNQIAESPPVINNYYTYDTRTNKRIRTKSLSTSTPANTSTSSTKSVSTSTPAKTITQQELIVLPATLPESKSSFTTTSDKGTST